MRNASALLAVALCGTSNVLMASGDDGLIDNVFMPEYHVPVPELQGYAAGKLGVVTPGHWRVYHFLAYRALTSRALSKDELALLAVRGHTVGADDADDATDAPSAAANWIKARGAVRGAPAVGIDVMADVGQFTMIVNCPADAFARAGGTLAQRVKQGGQQWAAVWLANQDAVFANCSPEIAQRPAPVPRPMTLPPPLPAKAPAWLVKDHAYQRAAAHFYAGRFDEARAQFLAIATDAASPWQPLGKYLAARALVRSATAVPQALTPELRVRLGQARTELAAIAPDYAPARALITWIDIRVRPEERRRELSAALAVKPVDAGTPQMVVDYLFLMDKLEPDLHMAADPMTAWIGAMQASSGDSYSSAMDTEPSKRRQASFALARAHWDARHEPLWLVALLTNARRGELKPAEARAAAALKPDSPAFVHLQYHLARLALAEGRARDADAIVSALLEQPQAVSVRNRLLRMKMVSAATDKAAFAAAKRTPAEQELPVPVPNEGLPQALPQFDDDLRAHLARHLPLATMARVKPLLPAAEQKWLAELAWTRAALLGEYALADGFTDDLARGRASTLHLYERYKKAATAQAKRDAALLIFANTPELDPRLIGDEVSRQGRVHWSCADIGFSGAADDGMELVSPAFVSAAERALLDKEKAQLGKVSKRSSYLIPRVLEWARHNKTDREAPKALHFLIASTRNECSSGAQDDSGRRYSKEAYEYLHRHYPKSEWAAKTRYYY
ncbi:hypothetical protein C7C56_003690 [Massilia glaciei]|uniref:Uncharacterized protein n=1 Tax=Massilia glaciei TaxID=1524097 RepID=A0A2U2I600_9BURK|nr:hypothetical protein C7C56_003690 [Massilia glaciei]